MFVEEKEVGEVKELDEAARLLLKAAAIIEQRGLAKGTLCDESGAVCARGALNLAAHGHPHWKLLNVEYAYGAIGTDIDAADARLATALGYRRYRPEAVPNWNNHPDRTAAEVVAKLRAVALGG